MPSSPESISALWALPFAAMLAAIALMPFIRKHWWEKNYPIVTLALGGIAAACYILIIRRPGRWLEGMADYVKFIILLGSLYIVSGGIAIRIGRKATPLTNCVFLLIGACLANLLGTTGAAMILIRPYLRMNRGHIRPYHVVFFIFIIANAGGCLTPIGDPPLFLGYLKGVPFWWTLNHMTAIWATGVGILLAIFFIIDTIEHGRSERQQHDAGPQVHLSGAGNLIFIGIIIASVAIAPIRSFFDLVEHLPARAALVPWLVRLVFCREGLMVGAALLSLRYTPRAIHQANAFSYGPIREVAILFLGIFSTMIPALHWLELNADKLRLRTPGQVYYATGGLSSVLDNAPTYLTFLKARMAALPPEEVEQARLQLRAMTQAHTLDVPRDVPAGSVRQAVEQFARDHPDELLAGELTDDHVRVSFLLGVPALNLFVIAISAGSVLWGACTYIGNGPNFMVRSIADASGVHTPSFMGYIFRYSLPILLPTYVLIWLIFFA